MQTILDTSDWFLATLVQQGFDLEIILQEAIRSEQPENLTIADHTMEGVYRVESTLASRIVKITFGQTQCYQGANESIIASDQYEEHDGGRLRRYSKSRYLDFAFQHFALLDVIYENKYSHYRFFAADDVIDVIRLDEPIIEILDKLPTSVQLSGSKEFLHFDRR